MTIDKTAVKQHTAVLLAGYLPEAPKTLADALRDYWLTFAPLSTDGIPADQRGLQETVGTPIPVLKAIGSAIGNEARHAVPDYLPLARLLWDAYGREGRAVAAASLGPMELASPAVVLPHLLALCTTCHTWEDADRLAMDAVEPVVRKQPELWLGALDPWLEHDNKWVRRAAITVIGRLAMQQAAYAAHSLRCCALLLGEEDRDVKRAVSFALRVTARGDADAVRDFLAEQVPPDDPAAAWVLCDAVRSMAAKLLPLFVPLLPLYEAWATQPDLSGADRRSVESAIKTLHNATAG